MPATKKRSLIERLQAGEIIIGDGGFVFSLEKRGYVKAGPWTPEAVVEHPEAVKQLHREFLRAGADVMQAFTFYASDDKLENRGHDAGSKHGGEYINKCACDLAKSVAAEGDALWLGGVCQTPTYLSGTGKKQTQDIFRKQFQVFKDQGADFLLCEYFEHVEEAEWAVEAAKEYNLPVAVSMCIGTDSDMSGVPTGEVGIRLVKAGADIVGINCHFDPFICIDAVKVMKKAIEDAGLKTYYMVQPLGYQTPEANRQGFIDLPEFPFALEPRVCTRFEMAKYARKAFKEGIQYIGGCCGFEPYHIRAVSEELSKERGKMPLASEKHLPWGGGLAMHTKPWVRARANRDYWETLNPSSGRPFSATLSKPEGWDIKLGDEDLKQHKEQTDDVELKKALERKKQVDSLKD